MTERNVALLPACSQFGGASGAGGSGAAGLNLTHASVAILLEPQISPGIEQQAVGRICRIGQQCSTTCIRLIIKDSLEGRILSWQRERFASGTVQQHLDIEDFVRVLG
jgi:SNF2 family DNA or RNA helicase